MRTQSCHQHSLQTSGLQPGTRAVRNCPAAPSPPAGAARVARPRGGREGGGGRVAGVPAALRRRPIETPAPVPVTGAYPNATPPPTDAGAISSHRRSDGAAAVPAGTRGGEVGARHPAGGSLRGSQPLYLRRAALRTDQRGSAWRTRSAPAGLSRGRVVSSVLGVVGSGRGEPRAGHSADQGTDSRHSAPSSGSLACQLQLGFKRLPVSSSRGVLVLGGRSLGVEGVG